ncbi:hypothetical protein FLAV_00827 [Flavobacteriales bacterium]|nr:carboxypeptidase-like regulatory domain-containing protein [Bacteroidota bacterium]MBV6461725.1 hypothetical protein [Flavobacteriales bacterium]MCL4815510.1 carboxypeptidase-like regulatory domain-containing protein [Flavobacteriales bacterium]WKZ75128.1 MAG: DUF5686 family protein [Vicingaceae bacterium]CAG0963444.1 hypothetical protein FLAV_00827 [Flavobacteriales bacterium]
MISNLKLICQFFAGIFFLINSYTLFAQTQIKGRVFDKYTKEPLSFVTVAVKDAPIGMYTDVEGRFLIKSNTAFNTIILSYIGYEKQEIQVSDKQEMIVYLVPTSYLLKELVVLPGENPAHRIINKVIENRKINNPEKACSFSYTSYNKLIFTGNTDSTLLNNPEKLAQLDSSSQKEIAFFEKQHLFLTESVSERKFMPPAKNYEKIIANRVSGFTNPVFSLLGTQLQSFSFYNDYISLLDYKYLSPITPGSTSKYLFILEDTLYDNNDSIFIISFQPKKNKNIEGMKGLLYIHTDGYALKNVMAEPFERKGGIQISIRQQYQKIDNTQWFPVQLNTSMNFDFLKVNNTNLVGMGWAYLTNIKINPGISKKEIKNVELEVSSNAHKVEESFWNQYRPDSLTEKETKTYHVIDSIGKAEKLDLKLKTYTSLVNGQIPFGPLSIDIDKIINYNGYEGTRLGMGIHTNEKITQAATLGGYVAYGIKDKEWKLGCDASIFIAKSIDMNLRVSYQEDVVESGGISFYNFKIPLNSSESYRILFVNRMDRNIKTEAVYSFRFLRYWKINLFANEQYREITNAYFYDIHLNPDVNYLNYLYHFYETGIDTRFAFKEKLAKTPLGIFPIPGKFPVIRVRYGYGLRNDLKTNYYQRIDLRADKGFFIKNMGRSNFTFLAGYTNSNVPYTLLYNTRGTFENFSVSTANTFETMHPNEFLSNRYASLHYRHSFGSLLLKTKHFEPKFTSSISAGWGTLTGTNNHKNISFNTMEKGYYEGGIIIDNILKIGFSGFGISGFYRFGPYTKQKTAENTAVKLSLTLSL